VTESGSSGDPGTPPPPPPSTSWAAPVAAPPAQVPNAKGFVYADIPNRAIAFIIDGIIVGIVNVILLGIVAGIFGIGVVFLVVALVLGLALGAAYFIYTWTSMRATLGMKVLGMQIGNAGDGKTLTMDQAVRRWLVLFAPFTAAQVIQNAAGVGIGGIVGLLAFIYFIYLIYTTYKSPTKQGFHDVFANTMVVKATNIA
jgi:uncharacterized RDD family membrane protein YckC